MNISEALRRDLQLPLVLPDVAPVGTVVHTKPLIGSASPGSHSTTRVQVLSFKIDAADLRLLPVIGRNPGDGAPLLLLGDEQQKRPDTLGLFLRDVHEAHDVPSAMLSHVIYIDSILLHQSLQLGQIASLHRADEHGLAHGSEARTEVIGGTAGPPQDGHT
mgnify:CR=1 FL=1